MNQLRSQSAHRSGHGAGHSSGAAHAAGHGPRAIELGNEPPLSVDGDNSALVDRRRVSVQWFSGTILTGLCGAALMGGAVFTSLDGETNFASLPERVEVALRGALGGGGDKTGGPRKADRLPPAGESTFFRQVLRDTQMTRVGDREVARVRSYMRITGNLSLTVSELSAHIPKFNPQRMLADAAPGAPEDAAAEPDAEVAFVMRDLMPMMPRLKLAASIPVEEIQLRVREVANWSPGARGEQPVAAIGSGMKLAYAVEGGGPNDPYAGFEARIVPENITLLAKTTTQATGGNAFNERILLVKKGDSAASLLRELGASADEIKAIAAMLGRSGRDGGLKEGQKLRVLMSPVAANQRLQPIRVIVAGDTSVEAVVALSDTGKYVAVDVQNVNTEVAEGSEEDGDDDGSGVRLYQSVYETALRNQVPRPVIDELIRIYSYDVDFQRKVQPGDSFEVMFAGEEDAPAADARSEVLFAALTVGGENKKFYRFQSGDDGIVDYYDESGKSAKKFLVRKPVAEAIMRSPFGVRRHPMLGYTKMHTGVDWAAPTGTPIYAAGNGVVEKAGWESGYGKYVRLRHNNGYETAYGHMTAFARNMDVGTRVRQGQVIGFVGSTGLSTGAHVHYEILVNGRFVDPMRIKLPRGRVLDGPVLANFERERDRVDGMMSRKPARVAQSTGQATR